jgi:hypothetical protein
MSEEWNYDQWFASPDGMKAVKSLGERYGLELDEINDPSTLAKIIVNAIPQSAPWLPKSLIDKDEQRDAKQLLGQLAGDYPDEQEMCGWLAMLKNGVTEVSIPYYGGTDQIDLADDFVFQAQGGNGINETSVLADFHLASGLHLEDYFWKNLDDSGAGDGTTYTSTWTTSLVPHFSQYTSDPVWDENDEKEWDAFDSDYTTETPLGEQLDENRVDE